MPDAYPYAPSQAALRALRPGMTVRLRALAGQRPDAIDTWDSCAFWAEILDRRGQMIRARATTAAPLSGIAKGDLVEHGAYNVFDFFGPELPMNPERLPTQIGRTVLLGITVVSHQGDELERRQFHGAIRAVDQKRILVEIAGGDVIRIPPTFALLDEAPPGRYRLRSSGDVVVRPDLLSELTIALPEGSTKWPGPRRPA